VGLSCLQAIEQVPFFWSSSAALFNHSPSSLFSMSKGGGEERARAKEL